LVLHRRTLLNLDEAAMIIKGPGAVALCSVRLMRSSQWLMPWLPSLIVIAALVCPDSHSSERGVGRGGACLPRLAHSRRHLTV
jgi:hypothetical protein